jgi:hypothetical protein
VEAEHRRYRGEELGLVADAERGAVADGELFGADLFGGELFGGRRHAARMRGGGWVMGALLRSAVDKVRRGGLDRGEVDNVRSVALLGRRSVAADC